MSRLNKDETFSVSSLSTAKYQTTPDNNNVIDIIIKQIVLQRNSTTTLTAHFPFDDI